MRAAQSHILFPLFPPRRRRRWSSLAFAYRDLWNVDRCPSLLRLDVDRPNHLAPLLRVVSDELAEIGGRAGTQRAAELDQPRVELRILERCVDLPVEPVDDRDRRCLRCTDAEQRGRLVARNEFAHCSSDARHIQEMGAFSFMHITKGREAVTMALRLP